MVRLTYIDAMRGLAILLVVLGHIYIPYTSESNMHPVNCMIYSFHMSFFFFISGYINQKTHSIDNRGWRYFIYKKATSLLIPYIFWLLIAPLFLYNSYPTSFSSLIELFKFFPNQHIWFLPTLFIFMFLFLIGHKIIEKRSVWGKLETYYKFELFLSLLSIGIWSISGLIFHQYHLIIYGIYWFSFLFGNFLSKYPEMQDFLVKKSIYGISASLLCLAWKFYPLDANGIAWKSFINLALSFLCSLFGCITIFNFFFKIRIPNWISKYFQEMGKYSLVIYVVPIVLFPEGFVFPEIIPSTLINLLILAIGILHTLISYTFGRIVFEIPYLRFIMFGKK